MYIPSRLDLIKLALKHPKYHYDLIRRKIRFYQRYKWVQKCKNSDNKVGLPLAFKLYLTLKCDLQCKMCMFWGDAGVYKNKNKVGSQSELDWKVIKNIFQEAKHYHPFFILSGGEPLLYSHFEDLLAQLKETRCFAYICTNGVSIDRFMNAFSNNPYIALAISLDGTEEINDFLRGKGVFRKVVQNIKMLKSLKKPPYMSLQFTLQRENVGVLYDTCKAAVKLGLDWILINFRWCLTKTQAKEYERDLKSKFNVCPSSHISFISDYDINREEFLRQCDMIKKQKWPVQVSSYLKKAEDINAYLDNSQKNPYNNFCWKQWLRMDVMPNADVTPCIQYPDLIFGNLKERKLLEVWNSSDFYQFRQFIRKENFSVCSRCYCLYLYDANRYKL